MEKALNLKFITELRQALLGPKPLIQVVMGPRQVGKTTGVQTLLRQQDPALGMYFSADGELPRHSSWIDECWNQARAGGRSLLVLDEIQKVENWSEKVKALWDAQAQAPRPLQLILLGSGSLSLQRGLTESLAGRFLLHRVHHWNFAESSAAFGLSLEEFLRFGGYPGSYRFLSSAVDWLSYLKNSIVEPVIGKDILSIARVKSPALFKQTYDLAVSYGAQEISYTKLLGQLQDRGNTDLVKHYLELMEGAFLLKQLQKFSNKQVLVRGSSPKILPLCPALFSVTLDADYNESKYGRAFEIAVGAELNRLPGQIFYWREKNLEVDYVYRFGQKVTAIEVKYGKNPSRKAKGLAAFRAKFPGSYQAVVTPENFQEFIQSLLSQSNH